MKIILAVLIYSVFCILAILSEEDSQNLPCSTDTQCELRFGK